MLGEIAAGWKLVAAAKEGFDALKGLQPEYARFWKKFEAELKPESRDLPWDRLESLRVDPEFCGQACGLIRGDGEKRKAMRERIASIADPPEDSRYDKAGVIKRVMRAAEDSAVAAAKEDRDVTARQGRLVEGEIRALREEVRELREILLKLQPAPPDVRGETRSEMERLQEQELGYDYLQLPAPRPQRKRAASVAERRLRRILEHDPQVQVFLPSAKLREGDRRYIPDFAVKDSKGTNWFIEVKGDLVLESAARNRVGEMARLTKKATAELSGDWRFVLVTPSTLSGSESWSDILEHAPEPPGS